MRTQREREDSRKRTVVRSTMAQRTTQTKSTKSEKTIETQKVLTQVIENQEFGIKLISESVVTELTHKETAETSKTQYVLQTGKEVKRRRRSTNEDEMSIRDIEDEQDELLKEMLQHEQEEEKKIMLEQSIMIRELMSNYRKIRDRRDDEAIKEKKALQEKMRKMRTEIEQRRNIRTHVIDKITIHDKDGKTAMACLSGIFKAQSFMPPDKKDPPSFRFEISLEQDTMQIVKGIYKFGDKFRLLPANRIGLQPEIVFERRTEKKADEVTRESTMKPELTAGTSKHGGKRKSSMRKQTTTTTTTTRTREKHASGIKAETLIKGQIRMDVEEKTDSSSGSTDELTSSQTSSIKRLDFPMDGTPIKKPTRSMKSPVVRSVVELSGKQPRIIVKRIERTQRASEAAPIPAVAEPSSRVTERQEAARESELWQPCYTSSSL